VVFLPFWDVRQRKSGLARRWLRQALRPCPGRVLQAFPWCETPLPGRELILGVGAGFLSLQKNLRGQWSVESILTTPWFGEKLRYRRKFFHRCSSRYGTQSNIRV
jgi:hypothetical protein